MLQLINLLQERLPVVFVVRHEHTVVGTNNRHALVSSKKRQQAAAHVHAYFVLAV